MLTERQLSILHAIVDEYIRSAEPIGSRSISKRHDISFSPATIRNDMSDLEELGFLEKPHSSAGRIPSQKGYRFYVDHLLMPRRLTMKEKESIQSVFSTQAQELEEMFKQSARVLSEMTSYISIVLGPEMEDARLRSVQIVPLSSDKAILILVSSTGHVENQMLHLSEHVQPADLERVVNMMNQRLMGIPLYKLQTAIQTELAHLMRQHVTAYDSLLESLQISLSIERSHKVFYSGKTNILNQPEFRDLDKVRLLYNFLEEDQTIHKLLSTQSSGLQVKIGHENKLEAFDDCSMITADYSVGDQHVGTIGIIGPTRMEYQRVINVVDYLSKDLTKLLTSLYR
ncbi:heat-inducible transcriptional repressor HrcA [Alkalicoccobacillus porphyridii]|uniref:Heat-inducible transcription repressor HrcA n=1 Tax=Alkalicoccobacillus porphyridii TaxID=2597270 RepID=A0A553ZZB7_9BACI|nr:heat-inducible transcriptional repressor HrcA [Alkalicoccobacillus porphyridii]TSB46775.1 heat-inducible transcriptional repressor HrcA [Alkalicoccobacillus porphyridii]